jgi:predicted nucleotidyltransferase
MKSIAQIIKTKLKEIEAEHDIKILYACESGSRAWGFPSPDSDYDARFLYVHNTDWYMAINEQADTIDIPINGELDINGWEIRKSLRLLTKHNAVLYEWIQSPIIYRNNNAFRKEFTKIATDSFSPISCIHHYLSMVKGFYKEIEASDEVKLKKYLYCYRASLAANWIAEKKSVPPMEIEKLSKGVIKNVKLVKQMRCTEAIKILLQFYTIRSLNLLIKAFYHTQVMMHAGYGRERSSCNFGEFLSECGVMPVSNRRLYPFVKPCIMFR